MEIVSPADVGVSSKRLTRLSDKMQRYLDGGRLTCVLTMAARRGKVFHLETRGVLDLETKRAIQPDSIFRIYSMTKPIVSVALMMLYEEGAFHLFKPVSDYLPEFKAMTVAVDGGDSVKPAKLLTAQHLLSHSAGVPGGAKGDTLETWTQSVAAIPFAYHPGSQWRYSAATNVVGRLVEVFSGQPLDAFLQERIFEPLGMTDTAFYVPSNEASRFASMYGKSDDGSLKECDFGTREQYMKNPTFHSAVGGLVGTAGDYMRFAQMLLNGGELDGVRLLGRKTVELMAINHLDPSLLPIYLSDAVRHWDGFGLGFGVTTDMAYRALLGSVGAYGWCGMASTTFWVDPVEELIGIQMTQYVPDGDHNAGTDFRALLYQALED